MADNVPNGVQAKKDYKRRKYRASSLRNNTMKQIIATLLLILAVAGAMAQEPGDALFENRTRELTYDRMIPPYGIEVTYDKTVHIIFPAAIRYVDLGSRNLVAGKAGVAENVLRVKAAMKGFEAETNLSVITESGSFYTFNVRYADEPRMLFRGSGDLQSNAVTE